MLSPQGWQLTGYDLVSAAPARKIVVMDQKKTLLHIPSQANKAIQTEQTGRAGRQAGMDGGPSGMSHFERGHEAPCWQPQASMRVHQSGRLRASATSTLPHLHLPEQTFLASPSLSLSLSGDCCLLFSSMFPSIHENGKADDAGRAQAQSLGQILARTMFPSPAKWAPLQLVFRRQPIKLGDILYNK
ncbi:hypothetical protein VFPPC_16486 [Pochonia chlamydosporia 170]|uniref:Uncharacterized protein n=1 Tax=Pochonia chlamydosporia 170 TaxID=1380566 RepID=A0A179FDW0_METCM|nr:hypothetical protein VFPPC_16486 [Pochonia chlamydosporia 170]OAQ63538.1 hypothetical protein VFPPC_16486 [Pochonia chlamydosporia 170]